MSEPAIWLVEINAPRPGLPVVMPIPEMAMGGPTLAPDLPVPELSAAPVLRLVDRRWVREPGDAAAPTSPYLVRLATPPIIARQLPIYPDEERRAAYNEAELELLNADGALAELEGDWRLAGASVVLRRGPQRRPLHAPFSAFERVTELRVSEAPSGSTTLQLPLSSAAADLSGALCATFGGTGGADGPAGLTGQARQEVFGYVRNVATILTDGALGIWSVHPRAIQQIVAARDRALALTPIGNVASRAALAAAQTPATGQYLTCLASGDIRTGGGVQGLTVDVRGDVGAGGYGGGSPARIAVQILRGPGGISTDRALEAAFASWPTDEAGMVIRDGSVADALSRLAAGIYAWWDADAFGAFRGGIVAPPESMVPTVLLDERVLAGPPEPTGAARAPWWRATVGYQALDAVQATDSMLAAVTAADRAYYSQASRTAAAADVALRQFYPLAEDGPEVAGVLEAQAAAAAVAARIIAVCGKPRGEWRAPLRSGDLLAQLPPGACARVLWRRRPAFAAGRNLLVRSVDGEGERPELVLWG
ncbi:hypothetical protein VQH23_16305 [Pararoseomonas sp. SCSIO 73927]|uniref:hypothetical protein n=1 Tax=Pararoseomonas sp. SCSIO 73927 TaxID=3114537 RepID=UPI0030D613B3